MLSALRLLGFGKERLTFVSRGRRTVVTGPLCLKRPKSMNIPPTRKEAKILPSRNQTRRGSCAAPVINWALSLRRYLRINILKHNGLYNGNPILAMERVKAWGKSLVSIPEDDEVLADTADVMLSIHCGTSLDDAKHAQQVLEKAGYSV